MNHPRPKKSPTAQGAGLNSRHPIMDQTRSATPPHVPVNLFRSTMAKTPVSARLTLPQLAARMRRVKQVPRKECAPLVTFVDYHADAAGRKLSDIEAIHAVVGDIDHGFNAETFEHALAEIAATGAPIIAHQTFSHSAQAPRWRVFVFLDQPIRADEYRVCWAGLNDMFGGMLDTGAKDAARVSYWPSCPPGEEREVRTLNFYDESAP